jgi:hypothetical protein
MDLEFVASFSTLIEAQVVCSALRAAGVPAQLMDQNFSSILPTQPLGGFRVAAPYGEAARARRLLASITGDGGEPGDP